MRTLVSWYLIDGFLGKNEYAASLAKILTAKLMNERCPGCSIWHMFLSSSFTVCMTDLFLNIILSFMLIRLFFILLRIPVIPYIENIIMLKTFETTDLEQKQNADHLAIVHCSRASGRLPQNEVFCGFIKVLAKFINHAENISNFMVFNYGFLCD